MILDLECRTEAGGITLSPAGLPQRLLRWHADVYLSNANTVRRFVVQFFSHVPCWLTQDLNNLSSLLCWCEDGEKMKRYDLSEPRPRRTRHCRDYDLHDRLSLRATWIMSVRNGYNIEDFALAGRWQSAKPSVSACPSRPGQASEKFIFVFFFLTKRQQVCVSTSTI
jgi:hypothetical protein